jgi:predicted nucleic acid-binding protein
MILVDSSVLIDVIESKPIWGVWSVKQLFECSRREPLAINIVIYAEISRAFLNAQSLDTFLKNASILMIDIPNHAGFSAARAHDAYRAAGGVRSATLPDFFIGAHASTTNSELLTRDPKRVRTYFPDIRLITHE